MQQVSLSELIEELTKQVLNNTERTTFYYRREWEKGKPHYIPITEVDLMDSRFRTEDGDFSEYEWELEKSNIYKE